MCQLAFQGITPPTVKEREWTADALGDIDVKVLLNDTKKLYFLILFLEAS